MKILFLSLYFEPDLCAGSFRNTSLFKQLLGKINEDDHIHVISSLPNRYASFSADAKQKEEGENYTIDRVNMPKHNGGMFAQIKSYSVYFKKAIELSKKHDYDLVYASSSRLFTAVLGSYIARRKNCPLYLDIRDIFSDSMRDYFNNKPLVKYPGLFTVMQFEKYAFNRAQHINIVSEGFATYFKRYPKAGYSYFTNGIDDIFLESSNEESGNPQVPYVITYAGNIGQGQELEIMVPQLAQKLGPSYEFQIIGDGGTRDLLDKAVSESGVTNVKILKPVPRKELIEIYKKTDFFFTKLNILEKVALPSKVFEYGAFDKPIICALSGYANEFVRKNVPNVILSEANDVDGLVEKIRNYQYRKEKRTEFVKKYSRGFIMDEMANDILKVVRGK